MKTFPKQWHWILLVLLSITFPMCQHELPDIIPADESVCGNGLREGQEECDDGNTELSDNCPSGPQGNCKIARCGDGYIQEQTEFCDDGNQLTSDGCNARCGIEEMWTCHGQPSICDCENGYQDNDLNGSCLPTCTSLGWTTCGGNGTCSEATGQAICTCESGYETINNPGLCQKVCPDGQQDNDRNEICEDTCETAAIDCGTQGSCSDDSGHAQCVCNPYWYGNNCHECRVYVDSDDSIATRDGTSWAAALLNPQTAIDIAYDQIRSTSFTCDIWMAQGTYYVFDTSKTDTIRLRSGTRLYGGFESGMDSTSDRDPDTYQTILEGQLGSDENFKVYHVVHADENTIIDGIQMHHGNANAYDLPYNVGGCLYISGNRNILVRNTDFIECSSANYGSAVYIGSNASATMENITISLASSNSSDYQSGGALAVIDSELVLSHATLSHNTALYGGAIVTSNASVTLAYTTFESNSCSNNGGAIYASENSHLTITDCDFTNNQAQKGATIAAMDSMVTIMQSTFDAQAYITASEGGIGRFQDSTVTIYDTIMQNGYSNADGGAIWLDGSSLWTENLATNSNTASHGAVFYLTNSSYCNISDSYFSDNYALNDGGVVSANNYSFIEIENSQFTGNSAKDFGGVFDLDETAILINNSLFDHNTVNNSGGVMYAYYCSSTCPIEINNSHIIENTSRQSGGAFTVNFNYALHLNNSLIANNTSLEGSGGAAVAYSYGKIFSNQSSFIGNKSLQSNGGAMLLDTSELNISECAFVDNYAKQKGGAILLYALMGDSSATIEKSIFAANNCGGYGSAYYAMGSYDNYTLIDYFANTSIDSTITTGNTADVSSAISATMGDFKITNSTITSNYSANNTGPDDATVFFSAASDYTVPITGSVRNTLLYDNQPVALRAYNFASLIVSNSSSPLGQCYSSGTASCYYMNVITTAPTFDSSYGTSAGDSEGVGFDAERYESSLTDEQATDWNSLNLKHIFIEPATSNGKHYPVIALQGHVATVLGDIRPYFDGNTMSYILHSLKPATTSNTIGYGTDLSSDGFTDDIENNHRPVCLSGEPNDCWDIGAFELQE